MGIKEDGEKILQNHNLLFKKLYAIPQNRAMKYHEELKDELLLGKPRFTERILTWNTQDLTELHNHLQNIWDFFQVNSYWFDDGLKHLIEYDKRRISKKSIIFLLEQDIWCTDEVYGEYLIEETNDETIISYHRFDQKIQQFQFKKMSFDERKAWICQNAIEQIQNQFTNLWKIIENEIIICIQEKYHKFPPMQLKDNYITEQLSKCKELMKISPESTLLSLGRLLELWLMKILDIDSSKMGDDMITIAHLNDKITENQAKLFRTIRWHYNKLKHFSRYNILSCDLSIFLEKFAESLKIE
jgi:hypothetical protein